MLSHDDRDRLSRWGFTTRVVHPKSRADHFVIKCVKCGSQWEYPTAAKATAGFFLHFLNHERKHELADRDRS